MANSRMVYPKQNKISPPTLILPNLISVLPASNSVLPFRFFSSVRFLYKIC